jgi:hypothetical protein
MATRSLVLPEGAPARETFYVVKQSGSRDVPSTVTVLHGVPSGAEELGAFDNPNHAVDFAEAIIRDLNGTGAAVEMVDPPYGLVGTG